MYQDRQRIVIRIHPVFWNVSKGPNRAPEYRATLSQQNGLAGKIHDAYGESKRYAQSYASRQDLVGGGNEHGDLRDKPSSMCQSPDQDSIRIDQRAKT